MLLVEAAALDGATVAEESEAGRVSPGSVSGLTAETSSPAVVSFFSCWTEVGSREPWPSANKGLASKRRAEERSVAAKAALPPKNIFI
jgi:hypothetical protein